MDYQYIVNIRVKSKGILAIQFILTGVNMQEPKIQKMKPLMKKTCANYSSRTGRFL